MQTIINPFYAARLKQSDETSPTRVRQVTSCSEEREPGAAPHQPLPFSSCR